MAFKNEYVLPLEQETSEFFRKARETLRTGYSKFDTWTVDRERGMVLFRRGGGHSMESKDEDYWSFIDGKGYYLCDTTLLSKTVSLPDEIETTRSIGFQRGEKISDPNAETVAHIKEALREHQRAHLFNLEAYQRSRLTLIDAVTGKEIQVC